MRLFTCHSFVPRDQTLEAEVFLARVALGLCNFFILNFNNYALTLWVRTVLFEIGAHYLLIGSEPYKHLVCLVVSKAIYETVRNQLTAALMRALEVEASVPRVSDLKCYKVLVALSTEVVAAKSVRYEL